MSSECGASNLVEIAKRSGDFKKNYGLLIGAFLSRSIKCGSASIVVVASPHRDYRWYVGLLAALRLGGEESH
jgi:hypothetical protein